MKKRLFIFLLVVCLILLACNTAFAADLPANISQTEMPGISISTSDFREIFSGNSNAQTYSTTSTSISSATVTLSNIHINDENVSVTVHLQDGNSVVTLPITGTLAASYKTQNNINSAVIQVFEAIDGYEVLLFEIFNDTATDNLLLDAVNVGNSLASSPHIKIYLKNPEGNIYLFESEIPNEFIHINAFLYDKADKQKDALWALPYVNYTLEEIPLTQQLMTELGFADPSRALNAYSKWQYGTVNKLTYDVSSEHTEHYSVPYVEYKHVNVTSSDSTWIAAFKVNERTDITMYGEQTYTFYGVTPFQYRDISLSFACGAKSTFIRTYQAGRLVDYDRGILPEQLCETAANIAIKLLQTVVSELPSASSFISAQNLINAAIPSEATVRLGGDGVSLYNQYTVAVGEDLTGYYLDECTNYNGSTNNGHYYTFQAVLNYEGTGSTSTVGALKITFDIYNIIDMTTKSVSQPIVLSYTATP